MPNTARSRRRAVLGAATVALGPLLFAVTTFLNPYPPDDEQVRVLRDEAAMVTVWSLVWLSASLLLVAAVATVVGQVCERGSALVMVGGALAGAGAVASAAIAGFESVGLTLASAISDDEQLEHVLQEFETNVVLVVLYLLFLLGSAVGWPMLIGAAARGGWLSGWYVVPVAVATVGQVVPLGGSPLVLMLGNACFVLPLLILASRMASGTAVPSGGSPGQRDGSGSAEGHALAEIGPA